MLKKLVLIFTVTVLLALAAALWGCNSSPAATTSTSPTTGGASFKNDIQPVFAANCIVCHQGTTPPGGLSLEPAAAYKDLVNVKSTESALMRVAPGAPDKSYLINKLSGTQVAAGGSGAQMPFGRTPLTQAQIELISSWISAGAPNN